MRRGKAGSKIIRDAKLCVSLSDSIPTQDNKLESAFLPEDPPKPQRLPVNGWHVGL